MSATALEARAECIEDECGDTRTRLCHTCTMSDNSNSIHECDRTVMVSAVLQPGSVEISK